MFKNFRNYLEKIKKPEILQEQEITINLIAPDISFSDISENLNTSEKNPDNLVKINADWKKSDETPNNEILESFLDQKNNTSYVLEKAHEITFKNLHINFDELAKQENREKLEETFHEIAENFLEVLEKYEPAKKEYDILENAPFATIEGSEEARKEKEVLYKKIEETFRDFHVLKLTYEQLEQLTAK